MGNIVTATRDSVFFLPPGERALRVAEGLQGRHPTCVAAGPDGAAWAGTNDSGVYRSDDGGRSWRVAGLGGRHIMALTVDPVRHGIVWAGTEPSAVWMGRFEPDGDSVHWESRGDLSVLPSSDRWAFPPRPETHHVRWIACHPAEPGRLWAAIEAGALISTADDGATWQDRVDGSPHDTHELAIHPDRPEMLRISAGDGYFESPDGGRSWQSPMDGLDVGYLRSVAVAPDDPDVVVVSASSRARSAYSPRGADGRLFRREGDGPWRRVRDGWPEPPDTIAPLLVSDSQGGRILAADERGIHASTDGGVLWELLAPFDEEPAWLRGLAVVWPEAGRGRR